MDLNFSLLLLSSYYCTLYWFPLCGFHFYYHMWKCTDTIRNYKWVHVLTKLFTCCIRHGNPEYTKGPCQLKRTGAYSSADRCLLADTTNECNLIDLCAFWCKQLYHEIIWADLREELACILNREVRQRWDSMANRLIQRQSIHSHGRWQSQH